MVVDQTVRGSEGVKKRPDHYPRPEFVAPLWPYLQLLLDMAVEYDDIADNGEPTTAVEFVEWLKVDIERAAAHRNLIRGGRNRTG